MPHFFYRIMKRIPFIAALAFLSVLALSCGQRAKKQTADPVQTGSPKIVYNTKSIQLGSFSKDTADVLTLHFPFSNEGDSPLNILQVSTNCPCINVDYPMTAVAAGDSAEFKVLLDMHKVDKGKFRKSVTVITDCEPPLSALYIYGDVR